MKPVSHWVYLTAPLFVVAAILLGFTIRSLVRTLRGSVVATLPLQAEQEIRLDQAGSYDLYGEGSLGTSVFGSLDFALADAAGRPVAMRSVVFRTVVRSFSQVRLQLRSFDIDAPGTFTLRATGSLDPSREARLVLGRPVQGLVVLHILALVALGAMTIGSLVATALLIVQPTMQRPS